AERQHRLPDRQAGARRDGGRSDAMSDVASNHPPETGAFYPRDREWHPPALTPRYKSSILRSPQRPLISFSNTVSETTGPAFGHPIRGGLHTSPTLSPPPPAAGPPGRGIGGPGRWLAERGRGVPGVLVEFGQATPPGRSRHKRDGYLAPLDPNFGGCGR